MKNLISINMLEAQDINKIVEHAISIKEKGEKKNNERLKNVLVASLFFEPSTRTRLSFQAATVLAGGQYIDMGSTEISSIMKGESFEDTVKMVEGYSHIIVLRHYKSGMALKASKLVNIPVINAGDGTNEHPTQALQDIMTIYENVSRNLTTIKIGIVGDLKYGRAVHSLVFALLKLRVGKIYFIAKGNLKIPQEIKDQLKKSRIDFEECEDMYSVLDVLDILYVTRIQKERFDCMSEYYSACKDYYITPEIFKYNKEIRIMHPFPRTKELSQELDCHENSIYIKQAWNGIYIRQAVMELLYKEGNDIC